MSNYNPNANGTIGLEWLPITEGGIVLSGATRRAVESILQTTAQTIGTIRVPVGSIPTRGGLYVLEVYDNETGVVSNVTSSTFVPNEDVSGVAAADWDEDDGTIVNIFDQIDESTLDLADFIKNESTATYYKGRMNVGATVNGKQILNVKLVVVARSRDATRAQAITLALNLSGTDYTAPETWLPVSGAAPLVVEYSWPYNPATKLPWVAAEVAALDTTDEWGVKNSSAKIVSGINVYQAYLVVTYCDENRIAMGKLDDTSLGLTANAWNAITMVKATDGTANFSKDGAGRHLYALRRLTASGSLVIPTLAAPEGVPNPVSGYEPTVDPTYGYMTAMNTAVPTVFGLIQRTTAPAESVDSHAYVAQIAATVKNGQDCEMELTAVAATYTRVRARVKTNSATADLLIKVKRRSDNLQFGTTITLTKAAVDALPDLGDGWRAIDEAFGTAPVLTATQFYVEFSSAATGTGDDSWTVLALDTWDQGNGSTFGGTTDRALVNASEADRYDAPTPLATVPTAVANFAAALSDLTLETDSGSLCNVTVVDQAHLTWTATGLGGSFLEYQIDRKYASISGADWERVAELDTEATVAWDDTEGRRGVQASYRIRVVRSDGAVSAWSATVTATPSASCCEWMLTTNFDRTLTVALSQEGYETAYRFMNAESVELLTMYLRDYVVAISGTEERGVQFDLPLIVQAVDDPATAGYPQGVAVFAALRALQAADVPYVCVLDSKGNVFYADLRVPRGDANTYADYYVAAVRVAEVTATPAVASS